MGKGTAAETRRDRNDGRVFESVRAYEPLSEPATVAPADVGEADAA